MNNKKQVIWKFPLNVGKNKVMLPGGKCEFLHLGYQPHDSADRACTMWATVNPDDIMFEVEFEVIGTGQLFDRQGKVYLASTVAGPYVWHLFANINDIENISGFSFLYGDNDE